MKSVKAYIRTIKVDEVVHRLEQEGICDMTIIDVMAIGRDADPKNSKYSIDLMEKFARIAKMEIVCKDDKIHHIVEIIRQAAYTGSPGDGIIYVTPVEMAVKIRTGAVNEAGL